MPLERIRTSSFWVSLLSALPLRTAQADAPDNLLPGRLAADFVIHDGVARHIDAHIRRALVGAMAVDLAEHLFQHGENLNIPVVVNRCLPIGFQMERVDHIDIS